MKTLPPARAAVAATALVALVAGSVGVAGLASASTEPVTASLAAPTGLTPDDCLDSTFSPPRDSDAGCAASMPHQVRKTVTLDWAPVSGATGYRVQVGTDSTWSDDPTLSQDVTSSQLTLPVWLPHASYVWRVAALKGAALGHWSSESTERQSEAQFTRGWRDAPVPVAVTSPFEGRPTYSWSPVDFASGYHLQVSDNPSFTQSTGSASPDTTPSPQTQSQANYDNLADCFTARTRVTPALGIAGADSSVGECSFTAPPQGTTLFWRVRALDAFVGTETPVDTTPVTHAGISGSGPVTKPEDSQYDSECPTTPAATASATASPSASASAEPEAPKCTPGVPSEFGRWSATSSFVYNNVDHSAESYAPALVTTLGLGADPDGLCTVTNPSGPDAEKATCTDVPTLRWNHVPGALRYRVTVGLDDEFTNTQTIVETSALQWTPAASWRESSPSTSYYYAVQACDDSSCGPVVTTPPSFRKVTPRLTVGTKPGVTGDVKLSWKSYADTLATASGQAESQDAYAYRVQVATSDHPAYDVLVDEATVDQTSYVSPDKSYGDGSFVWRVQAIDSAGHKLPWSLSQAFTRDATPPKVVSVTPASKVAAVGSVLTVTFSEPVTGVSASTLALSPAVPATVTVVNPTTARVTPTSALRPGGSYTVLPTSGIKDLSGNAAVASGPKLTVNPIVDSPSAALSYSGAWRTLSSSNAYGGSFRSASSSPTSKPSVTLPFTGAGISVTACLGPANGFVDLLVDGVRKARVSTYRSYSGCGVRIASLGGLARGQHTFRFVAVGAHAAGSTGNNVGFDAVTVTP